MVFLNLFTNVAHSFSFFSMSFHLLSSSPFVFLEFILYPFNVATRYGMARRHEQLAAHSPQKGHRWAAITFPLLLTSSIKLDTSGVVHQTSQFGILHKLSLESRERVELHTIMSSTSANGPREVNGSPQCITSFHLSSAMIAVCTSWMMELMHMLFPVVLFSQSSVQSNSPACPEEQTRTSEPLPQAGARICLCQ